MTTRNLNQTWRDVVFAQYEQDHAADVPFPVRYLINTREWKDIFIEIPSKIDVPVFRRAVLHFALDRRLVEDPAYEDELIKTSLALLLAAAGAKAWDFIVYGDSECETTPTAHYSGTGNVDDCTHVDDPHRSFELHNMGNCILELYTTLDACNNDDVEQFYDAGEEDECIPPDFQWDYYKVIGC